MTQERKSLSHDARWSFGATAARAVSAAIIFWQLARVLGTDGYGQYTAVLAVFLLSGPFVIFGVFHVVVQRVSRDASRAQESWGAALAPAIASSLVAAVLVATASWVFFPDINPWGVLALGLAEYLGLAIVNTAAYLLQALNRFPEASGLTVGWSIVRLGTVLVALYMFTPSFTGVAIAFLIAALIAGVCATAVAWRVAGPPIFSTKDSAVVAREGIPFALASSGSTVLNDLDKPMLLAIQGATANGLYSAGNRVMGLAAVPMFALLGATYPRFFAAGSENGVSGTRAFAKKLSPLVIIYSLLMGLGLFIAAPLIPSILGPEWSESIPVVRWMIFMPLLNLSGMLAGEVLTGADYQGTRNKLILGAGVVNIVFNAILIPLYSWEGAIVATYFSESTLLFSCLWWIKKHRNDPAKSVLDAELKTPAEAL